MTPEDIPLRMLPEETSVPHPPDSAYKSTDDVTPVRDSETTFHWAWGAAAVLVATAIPLLLFPRFILFLAESSGNGARTTLTPLESFLALHIGIMLVAIASTLVLNIPSPADLLTSKHRSPGHPLLGPLSAACTLIAVISYNTKSVGSLSLLVSLGSGAIGLWGFWAIMFEGTSSFSKKTGADKHTSRFLFGNKAAASSQKKRWRKAAQS